MFFFLPLGVEGDQIRFPLVGAGILLTCVLLFFASWAVPEDPLGARPEQMRQTVEYWTQRPYLEFPSAFAQRFVPKAAKAELDKVRATYLADHEPPAASVVADEQDELNRLGAEAVASVKETLFTRLALTRAKGLAQVGWVSHLFLHFGWLHLIGNMLFLYAVALLLEDAWGRGLFLCFYLVGGVVSAAAEFAMHSDSAMVMAGASGAVSACIGATMVRFAARRMRVGYLIFLGFFFRAGSFAMPVWIWGVFKAAGEVFDLATGATAGVAVLAHVAGLGFGAAVALAMRAGGLDRRFVGSDEASHHLTADAHPEVVEATAALAQGRRAEARALLEAAHQKSPDDVEIGWALMGLDLEEGFRARASQHFERVIQILLRGGLKEAALARLVSGWPSFDPKELRPGFAWQLVRAFSSESFQRQMVRQLAKRAGSEPSPVAIHAWIRAIELALEAQDPGDAAECLAAARALGPVQKDLAARLDELERQRGDVVAKASEGRWASQRAISLEMPAVQVQRRPEEILARARVLAVSPTEIELQLPSGHGRRVSFADLTAVGAGVVLGVDNRKTLAMVLVLGGSTMVRLDGDTAGIEALRPDLPPHDAYLRLVRWVVDRSVAAQIYPDKASLIEGRFTTFSDFEALEAGLFA